MPSQKANGIDLVFDGLTSAESYQRRLTLARMGPLYQRQRDNRWVCHPIYNWTEADVWNYIDDRGLRYNAIYDKGAKRCGCAPCTAYLSWSKDLKALNPKLYNRVVVLRRRRELCDLDVQLCGEPGEPRRD